MSQKSYRIKANVGKDDNCINVSLKRDIDTIKILSLEIDTVDSYKRPTSNYGVIVGRVLANNAFGVPNVKISVFVPLQGEDKNDPIISTEYPYLTPHSTNEEGVRYNLLSRGNSVNVNGDHKGIGTFPDKSSLLSNDGEMEVYDKYWSYTTTTNESGDYMIFGVPTGSCQVHYDCDLSDVGIISQKPYDMINKGYNKNLFKSNTEFLNDDLGNSVHILSENKTLYVHPFWGDENENVIGITRCDFELDYDFTPTCIFMGSCVTDSDGNYIPDDGLVVDSCGGFNQLTTHTGQIEMIYQTQDGYIETFKDTINSIIDENGVWCYMIPMNLDRIGTDEEGNIIPIYDKNKGIPTRARVRFRLSLNINADSSSDSFIGRILIPNNPEINEVQNTIQDDWAEFGINTPEWCFRDLYWGKIYSIKQYIPRILQIAGETGGELYWWWLAIRGINNSDNRNPYPYNNVLLRYKGIFEPSKSYQKIQENGSIVDKGLDLSFSNSWINGNIYMPRTSFSWPNYSFLPITIESTIKSSSFILSDCVTKIPEINQIYEESPKGGVVGNSLVEKSKMVYRPYIENHEKEKLFPTDIILLGQLNDIYDSLPNIINKLPITSSNFPMVSTKKNLPKQVMVKIADFKEISHDNTQTSINKGYDNINSPITGPFGSTSLFYEFRHTYDTTLQLNVYRIQAQSTYRENAMRICEIGVGLNTQIKGVIDNNNLFDKVIRSQFASMNYNLIDFNINHKTYWRTFKPKILNNIYYPSPQNYNNTDFMTDEDESYETFKSGTTGNQNSFYFYFGLTKGRTALDVFKTNYTYASEQEVLTTVPFECEVDEGNLTVTIKRDLSLPLQIMLFKEGLLIDEHTLTSITESTFITNKDGLYTVQVHDASNKTYTKNVLVKHKIRKVNYQISGNTITFLCYKISQQENEDDKISLYFNGGKDEKPLYISFSVSFEHINFNKKSLTFAYEGIIIAKALQQYNDINVEYDYFSFYSTGNSNT